MKRIYVLGFRGTGYRKAESQAEPLLIRVGHVGIVFEGDEGRIFGFHPTAEAARSVGDDAAVIAWLKRLHTLPGTIHDDTAIFQRAHELSKSGWRTRVWQMPISLLDEEFDRIRALALVWYTEQTSFTYSFPAEQLMPDRDNCATFLRRLGLPLPEATGHLVFFVKVLAERGQEWYPREDDHERSEP